MRKPTFWFPTCSDTNQAAQLQKMARGLKKLGDCTIYAAKTKALISFAEADLRLCFSNMQNVCFLMTRLNLCVAGKIKWKIDTIMTGSVRTDSSWQTL